MKIDNSIEYSDFHESEILARHLAYNAHLIKEVELIDESGNMHLYTNEPLHLTEGLIAYAFFPKYPIHNPDIKIIFRGTKNFLSQCRDIECSAGVGEHSFYRLNTKILSQLNVKLSKFKQLYPKKKRPAISITIAGHSLGGSDAQYFTSSILECIYASLDEKEYIHVSNNPIPYPIRSEINDINRVKTMVSNSTGISFEVSNLTNHYLKEIKSRVTLFEMKMYTTIVNGDPIQLCGETHLFYDAASFDVSIYVMVATSPLKGIRRHTGNLLHPKFKPNKTDMIEKNRFYERYSFIQLPKEMKIYSNHIVAHKDYIKKILSRKSLCLNVIRKSLGYIGISIHLHHHFATFYHCVRSYWSTQYEDLNIPTKKLISNQSEKRQVNQIKKNQS